MKNVLTRAIALVALSFGAALHVQAGPKAIRIGVLEDMSGAYADLSGPGSVTAAKLAIKDFGPMVLGRPIEIVSADHQNKPDIASGIARRWFDVDAVDMVVGLGNSAVAIAVQQLARDKNKIDIVTTAAATDLTGKYCSPTSVHWMYDTYSLANAMARAVVKAGGDTWYFVTSDYAGGHAAERDTTRFVLQAGGRVLGGVRHPFNNSDFASFLLQAKSSPAKVVALASFGTDFSTAVKQSVEFGLPQSGKRLAGPVVFFNDIHAIGLKNSAGLTLAAPFYWDLNDETRAWSRRFLEERKTMPDMPHAGTYGAVLHYLRAVKAAGTDDAKQVTAKMKELPINDFTVKNGRIREDGRVIRPMHLFEVKSPSESKGPWDYYRHVATVQGDEAFRPLAEGDCPLVKK
jgi:branched-chain amino acid transport system substrate-binding protein